MSHQRKYQRGDVIPNVVAAVEEIASGRYIYMNHKPQHPGWMSSMTLWTIKQYADHGRLFYAAATKEQK